MVDMSVKIGAVTLKNPVMPASGCFSTDLAQVMDLNRLGALVAKTVSREFRAGNPPPRAAEVEGGMINSIGLPTKGIARRLGVALKTVESHKIRVFDKLGARSQAHAVSIAISQNLLTPDRIPDNAADGDTPARLL